MPPESMPCNSCGAPTTNRADIDEGNGYKSVPVCDHDCLQDIVDRRSGVPGKTIRVRYPGTEM